MDSETLRQLLEEVRSGAVDADEAVSKLRHLPFTDLGFARVDHHRAMRQGLGEVVYGPGKTPQQCAEIVAELLSVAASHPVLLTRGDAAQIAAATGRCPGAVVTGGTAAWRPSPPRSERIVIVTAGTSDLAVAEECRAVLAAHGLTPELVADVGVAGVHRLVDHLEALDRAEAVVVVAGMEGALASIVGGLTGGPVIAVPTSVGYGASLAGVTALLSMLSSCASGMVVVGIDNGFGAACAVLRHLGPVESPGGGP
ncbi:MAG: Pyridinium-3,5-biscarboxylic acid mononucleotide synthase [Acidimicrobiales bacterium]|nr:MAG: nickel pincer cofactor biosynthesis protein LarB [Actinomycetota bacterium]MBV6510211.1 Pyridinium-3,5-biscarboxylic acid mononucleotide synthase [Acidimicrobiales bacterium]RIK03536.1 MAG: nickel pincer cofactor biosynthesis protein LarB [Acidobacteriota bacterium]